MAEKYTFSFSSFTTSSGVVNLGRLTNEIQESSIITALDFINSSVDHCDIWFKAVLSTGDETILQGIVASHSGEPLPEVDPTPRMSDGRPIVRADTRPLNTMTVFTGRGDDSTSVCGGVALRWDFSNDDDLYTGPQVPPGYKCKQLLLSFHCPVYMKDGTMYFFNAPWGAFVRMEIAVPPGQYYPNPAGNIPAAALGLQNDDRMFSNSGSDIVTFQVYVSCHYMYGDCPMGDEFNAEGAAIDALPPGWYVRALIFCPENDTAFKGFGNIELYRCHTCLLPGQTLADIIAEH
jgi:hypothetical protein